MYQHRRDEDWSRLDFSPFVVMENEGIFDALTADQHFEQAAFKALLK